MRIVSLLPAATEICFALGLGDDLVGVSPECDYPHAVREKPIVSHALLQYDGKTSGDTSRMVGERIRSGGALYQVDESALRASGPDLILTQGLCDVCAPTLGDVEDVAGDFLGRPSSNPWIHIGWKTCSRTSSAWAALAGSKRERSNSSRRSESASTACSNVRRPRSPIRRPCASSGSIRCSSAATGCRRWSPSREALTSLAGRERSPAEWNRTRS